MHIDLEFAVLEFISPRFEEFFFQFVDLFLGIFPLPLVINLDEATPSFHI